MTSPVRDDEQPGTKSEGRSAPPNPYGQELREKVEDVLERFRKAYLHGSGKWTDTEGREGIGYLVSISDFHRVRAILAALQHTEAGG